MVLLSITIYCNSYTFLTTQNEFPPPLKDAIIPHRERMHGVKRFQEGDLDKQII